MKAIFIKELRENLGWAMLFSLLIAIGFAWTFRANPDQPFASNNVFDAGQIGFAAAAVALGLLQTLQDQRQARYLFLMHRPVSASRIFWGKVLAGLILYLPAMAIPFLASAIWASTPGNIAAPFDWRMTLPGLWDLINGTTWYFAAILVGSRPARWFGSRVMPLAMPLGFTWLACSYAISVPEAMLVTLASLAVCIPMAWSSYVHAGRFERQSSIIKSLQSLSVAGGIALTLTVGLGLTSEFARTFRRPTNPNYTYWHYLVDPWGQIVRDEASSSGPTIQRTDVSGNPVAVDRPIDAEKAVFATNSNSYSYYDFNPTSRMQAGNFHNPKRYIESLTVNSRSHWFLLRTRNTIESFDPKTRLRDASVNDAGFAEGPDDPKPMPSVERIVFVSPTWIKCFRDDTHLYEIDFGSYRRARKIFETTPDDPIIGIWYYDGRFDGDVTYQIATVKALHLLRGNREIWTAPVQLSGSIQSWSQIARLPDGSITILTTRPVVSATDSPYRAIYIDPSGRVVSDSTLPKLPDAVGYASQWPIWYELERFVTPPAALIWPVSPQILKYGLAYFQYFTRTILVLGSLGAFGVVTVWFLTRRSALDWKSRLIWLAFGGATGLTGPLTFIAMRDWPVKVKCASCGKKRLLTREQCEHCDAPFPPPPVEGIEIFE